MKDGLIRLRGYLVNGPYWNGSKNPVGVPARMQERTEEKMSGTNKLFAMVLAAATLSTGCERLDITVENEPPVINEDECWFGLELNNAGTMLEWVVDVVVSDADESWDLLKVNVDVTDMDGNPMISLVGTDFDTNSGENHYRFVVDTVNYFRILDPRQTYIADISVADAFGARDYYSIESESIDFLGPNISYADWYCTDEGSDTRLVVSADVSDPDGLADIEWVRAEFWGSANEVSAYNDWIDAFYLDYDSSAGAFQAEEWEQDTNVSCSDDYYVELVACDSLGICDFMAITQ